MARVELPTDGALSLDMADGVRYNADPKHPGYIEVDNQRHLEEIRQTKYLRGGNSVRIATRRYAFHGASVECESCHFEQLVAFSANPCPRCGGKSWA